LKELGEILSATGGELLRSRELVLDALLELNQLERLSMINKVRIVLVT
jgi:hypothetical protein